jgi:hypothetical protein
MQFMSSDVCCCVERVCVWDLEVGYGCSTMGLAQVHRSLHTYNACSGGGGEGYLGRYIQEGCRSFTLSLNKVTVQYFQFADSLEELLKYF